MSTTGSDVVFDLTTVTINGSRMSCNKAVITATSEVPTPRSGTFTVVGNLIV
jgi:hypothetical protein